MLPLSFVVWSFILASAVCSDPPKASTNLGWVQGLYTTSRGGKQIKQFLGIPYAKPPTRNLRFKSPESPDPWEGILNATVQCSPCIQQTALVQINRTNIIGTEDCLCLNVFTPDVSSSTRLPVIVWIHGSAFMVSSSDVALYGPELLLDKDVVLVSFNHRLNIMGFMTTGDSVIPGNFGMKDQVLVLRWVKENIANFGGDPESITLFGESSGGVSADLHQYSHLSKGLFHKTIQHSGSALSGIAMISLDTLKNRTAATAKMVGCPTSPSTALLECMQALPAETIVNTTYTFQVWDIDPVVLWSPVVEMSDTEDAFLTRDPKTSEKVYETPTLTGFNFAEGAFRTVPLLFGDIAQKFKQWNEQFETLSPISLFYSDTELDHVEITRDIRQFYFGSENQTLTPDMVLPITDMYGDFWFTMGLLDTVEKRTLPNYLYYYNYNKNVTICPLIMQTTPPLNVGACHLDELTNLFPMVGNSPKFDPTNTDPDYLLSLKMVEMWTNFVKCSNPSTEEITWEPVETDALEHLEITNSGIAMKTNPVKERRRFWKTISALAKTIDREDNHLHGFKKVFADLIQLFHFML